jgi:hypothetical protein
VQRPVPARGRNDPTIAVLPAVPAGRYRVSLEGGGIDGWVMLGIGQDQFSLVSERVKWPAAPIDIDFPVNVRALIVRGDEDARRAVRRVLVEPLALVPVAARVTDGFARRAVKYGSTAVFFLDDRSFAEPEGFWIGGSRQSSFVVQADQPGRAVVVRVRNAPVENRLALTAGDWREELTLAPGEERDIQIPVAPGQRAAAVTATTTSGFRPSEASPESRDDRFLGVWIRPMTANTREDH